MRYDDDMSYVRRDLIERGLAVAEPYMIRLDAYVSDDRAAENRAAAEALRKEYGDNSPMWLKRCDDWRAEVGEEVHKLLEAIAWRYKIGQYERGQYGLDDCDLWFWCNDTRAGDRDYAYVTLSIPRECVDDERRITIFSNIKKLIENWPCEIVQAHFQFSTKALPDAMTREAERIYAASDGRYVDWSGYQGRLEKAGNGGYIFRKKYARKYCWRLNAADVCAIRL